MIDNAVESLAKTLRSALHIRAIRLSWKACVSESYSIWAVMCSLRLACLLSTLTISRTSLLGLEEALIRHGSNHGDNIFIAVHQASLQIFVVNKELFLRRWTEERQPNLYVAVDADSRSLSNRVKAMPNYLRILLSNLHSRVHSLSESVGGSVPILLLFSGNGTATQGVALAGWLLEYESIYFFESAKDGSAEARLWRREDDIPCTDDNEIDTRNCLGGVPLALFLIATADHPNLYQFTVPEALVEELTRAMSIDQANVHGICESIQARLDGRQGHSAFRFAVLSQKVVMDRVAL